MNNILIIKPSSFGDIIQALPVAARLKDAWPHLTVSWLVNTRYRRLLEQNPCVHKALIFDRHAWNSVTDLPRAVCGLAGLLRLLRREHFDAVLDLQGLLRSGIFTGVTGAPLRIGFAGAREGARHFYTRYVEAPRESMHAVQRYLRTVDALGCPETAVRFPLGIGPEEHAWAEYALSPCEEMNNGPLIGLAPAARWETKRWPAERFAALGDTLSDAGARVVVIGGVKGEGVDVLDRMKRKALPVLAIGDPLRLAALLNKLDLLICNDSGPMHCAAAVGTRVTALFGPTSPRRTGPHGTGHLVIRAPVDCRPCFKRRCDRPVSCMESISVEQVRQQLFELMPSLFRRG